jgi:Fe-coproporphyrin III synthase
MQEVQCRRRQKILQIHPTLKCNLECSHCYSSSGPFAQTRLSLDQLRTVLDDARELGYEVVSFSGGEPLLYTELPQLASHAKSIGYRVTLTTNGTLLHTKRFSQLERYLDLVAISLDGVPERHNRIRKSERAFDQLLSGLDSLKEKQIAYGFIHTVTSESWEDLLWISEFAVQNGAKLLQLHPLELTGRANEEMKTEYPYDEVMARVYLLTMVLAAKYADRCVIQFDCLHKDQVINDPESVYASDLPPGTLTGAEDLSPLIVEANGAVVPLSYGLSQKYKVCNLYDRPLREGWQAYHSTYTKFRNLCKEVYNHILSLDGLPFVNWYELVAEQSHR